MIRNYFKTAWRNILRNKLYSGINVLGLTVGLAVGMLILLWVQDETSFDGFHRKAANIYRVNSPAGMGTLRHVYETTPAAVAPAALREIPGVINAVRLYPDWRYGVYSYGDRQFEKSTALYADSNLLQMLDFRLLAGDPRKLWPNLQSVVITESTAKKYFGGADPMGKTILGDHKDPFVITGVLADFPDNSSIQADLLFPITTFRSEYDGKGTTPTMESDWGNYGYLTLLELNPGASPATIGKQLLSIEMREQPQFKLSLTESIFELQPFSQIHLRRADGAAPLLQTVRIFQWIAIFILLIASINYVNLSTARASVVSIVTLLSRDFLRLIGIAVVIASPLAGWGMYQWLQDFVYRTAIDGWVFVWAGGAAMGLALLTVGWQAVRAALANPVRALRSE